MSVVPDGTGASQGRRFGEVADLYERRRPSYPTELVADVVAGLSLPRSVLEVGAGTGKATRLLVAAGAAVTAVEPDPAMAAVLVRAGLPGVTVVPGTLEEAATGPALAGAQSTFAAVVAAQAWHWVDQVQGPVLARRLLRPDGVLAAFWNTPLGGPDYDAMVEVYRAEAPAMAEGMSPASWEAEMDERRRHLAEAEGFEAPETRTYDWTTRYDAEALSELVQTYSGHLMLDPEHLRALTTAVAVMVQARGGSVTFGYRTYLLVARAA